MQGTNVSATLSYTYDQARDVYTVHSDYYNEDYTISVVDGAYTGKVSFPVNGMSNQVNKTEDEFTAAK